MNYTFPVITHVDQIRTAIAGRSEFAIHDKGDYYVADYAVAFEDTFPPVVDTTTAILRECRGLMFEKESGFIISRPYAKFFNVSEKEETKEEKIKEDERFIKGEYEVLDKLDGSFIRPVNILGQIRLCTKMGITDQSLMAEEYVKDKPEYHDFFGLLCSVGATGLFEFCSRANQIVLDYPKPVLTLVAIRTNMTGTYYSTGMLRALGANYGIPVVEANPNYVGMPIADLIKYIREAEGIEGVVVRFNDGHMVKIKSEWYCTRHHAKDSILLEKNLITMFVEGKLDDILPLLDAPFRERVDNYIRIVKAGMQATVDMVHDMLAYLKTEYGDNQKAKAEFLKSNVAEPLRGMVFAGLSGHDVHDSIIRKILFYNGSSTRLEVVRPLFGANWV